MNAVRGRFDALDLPRQALGHTWPMVDFTVGVNKRDVSVWVDNARHAQVLVDALAATLIFGLHTAGDFKSVFFERTIGFFPKLSAFVALRRLVFARVQPDVNDGR